MLRKANYYFTVNDFLQNFLGDFFLTAFEIFAWCCQRFFYFLLTANCVCANLFLMKTRYRDYNPETQAVLRALVDAGCTKIRQDNGEYQSALDTVGEEKFIEDATACDECNFSFLTPDNKRAWIYLVFGNCPGEVICDYGVHPVIDKIADEHYATWNGKEQPIKEICF